LSADTQAKSWLKVGGDLCYTHYSAKQIDSEGSTGSTGKIFAYATRIAPIYPVYVRDGKGNIMTNAEGITMWDYGDGMNAGLSRPYLPQGNALGSTILDTSRYNGNAFNAQGYFEVRFLKDFKFTSNNAVSYDELRYTSITNPYYGGYSSTGGMVYKETDRTTAYTFQQLLT
ncbi:MAG: SusC/RagA family protein, partial [Paramuribaculum sp.]|nr:SusC/RagA family protein [Paramuribaculum sp.]